jgi:hypothetical protein
LTVQLASQQYWQHQQRLLEQQQQPLRQRQRGLLMCQGVVWQYL